MKTSSLKTIFENYNKPTRSSDDDFVSILAVEQVLKEKQNEFYKKLEEYKIYLSNLLNCKCNITIKEHPNDGFEVTFKKNILPGKENRFFLVFYKDGRHDIRYWSSLGKFISSDNPARNHIFNLINNDSVTKEFLSYCSLWNSKYKKMYRGLKTSTGLFIDTKQNMEELKILLSDANHNSESAAKKNNGILKYHLPRSFLYKDNDNSNFYNEKGLPDYSYKTDKEYDFNKCVESDEDVINFYYLKDFMLNTRDIVFTTDECKNFLNESSIGTIYSSLEVDISSFDKELQDEMKKFEDYYKLKLNEKEADEKSKTRKMQVERVLEAYKQLTEAIALLNNLQTEVNLERIKLDGIETIMFKNNRKPNRNGAIEIDDMFKNNMLLRMIDLSNVSLDGVDIRGIDFSNTNIHIDPQMIYNKDMTNVNASGVVFSPFSDKFDGTIIDGAIIDSPEAMINFETLKSFNEQTVIYTPKNRTK